MSALTRRTPAALRVPLILCGAALLALPLVTAAADQSGAELYRAACASCHGMDGTGAPASFVGFDTPVPDFTDCSFATREPDADWSAIAAHGGPVRGFSRLMPAFSGVLSAEEIALIMDHVRGFCDDDSWPRGDLNLPRPLVTEKAFPEDEVVFSSTIATEGPDQVSNKLIYEKRFGARNQVEIVLPFGWKEQPGDGGDSERSWGIGDVAVGVKRALYHDLGRGAIVSVTGEVVLPTGDEDKGFGKGTAVFEPFLTYGQILPADFFFQTQAGLELPENTGKAENEAFLRMALGRSIVTGEAGRTFSPMVELLGARELVSGESTNWDLLPQVQVTLNTRQHIMMNVGVRTPLNHTAGRDTQVLVYLLWDWFDGGFFEGW